MNQGTQNLQHKTDSQESPLVEVSKIFHASIEDVFRVWSDESLLLQWWGPEGMSCPYAKTDFKVGGTYLIAMQDIGDEDKTLWSTGSYLNIVPNKRIVMADQPADEDGNIITPEEAGYQGPWSEDGLAYITVEFEGEDDRTIMHLSHEGLPAHMHDECVEGWSSSLDKIKAIVEKH